MEGIQKGKIFISYRRQGGAEMARLIRDYLQQHGYNVFMDVEDLRSGLFNTALFGEIESSTDVIVVLTPDCLDRCHEEGDWLRLEVGYAIKNNKNVIPIMTRGFQWPSEPLPKDLEKLPKYNGIEPSHLYFNESMKRLTSFLMGHPKSQFSRRLWIKVAIAALCMLLIGGLVFLISMSRSPVSRVGPPPLNPAAAGRDIAATQAKNQNAPHEYAFNLDDGVKMHLIEIPPGSFIMGDDNGRTNERPAHNVTIIQPFYLGKYEVTQQQWEALMGDNPSKFKSPQNPVENVSWEDCQEFIKKINEKSKSLDLKFSLPTEAQWEYACRAGIATQYSCGDAQASLEDYAWSGENSAGATHLVGQKKPNAWGLYDMHGNVREWCIDWLNLYSPLPATNPSGLSTGSMRVFRGGDWYFAAYDCRSASRNGRLPSYHDDFTGFRVAAEHQTASELSPNLQSPSRVRQDQIVPAPISLPSHMKNLQAAEVLQIAYTGQPPATQEQVERPALQLEILARRASESTFAPLKDGDPLASENDDYFIVLRPLSRGFLYVFQIDSQGNKSWLFPKNDTSPYSSGSNPVKSEEIVQIPSAASPKVLYLDRNTGVEHLYAVFSNTQWPELEQALANPGPTTPETKSSTGDLLAADIRSPNGMLNRGIKNVRDEESIKNISVKFVIQRKEKGQAWSLPVSTEPLQSTGSFMVIERWFRHVNSD